MTSLIRPSALACNSSIVLVPLPEFGLFVTSFKGLGEEMGWSKGGNGRGL